MVGAIVSLVGAGLDAYGKYQQGQAQANANNYNANVTETNKYFALMDQARTATQTQGKAVAAYGASGVQTSTGSPLDVLADSAGQAALDRLKIGYNYDSQAALDRMGASNATTAATINATTSAMRGVGQAIPMFGSSSGSAANYNGSDGASTIYAGGTDIG